MTELKLVRELATIAILAALIGTGLAAVFVPERFGEWLQRIDAGRYHYMDTDCGGWEAAD